ncbi:MAG: cupredoxin domain-containing protein [Aeromicrobium sp.]
MVQLARLLSVPALLSLGSLSAPAVSAGNPCFHGFELPAASVGGGTEIKLLPCAFDPTITQVAEGSEVTFINGPDFTHLITGANQAWGSPDVEVQPGASISYTFDTAGIYPYACALHPGMSGAVVVGDADEALAGLAAGATGGSTSGGPTGTSAQGGSSTSDGSETTLASETGEVTSNADARPLVAVGIGAGLIAGAAAAWLAIRRRPPNGRSFVRAD